MRDQLTVVIGSGLLLAGGVMSVVAIALWLRRASVRRKGIQTRGRIIAVEDYATSDSYDWRARVQFHTREGRLVECVSQIGHPRQLYQAGDEVSLHYHPADPRRVVLERDKPSIFPIVLLAFAVVLVAVGGAFLTVKP